MSGARSRSQLYFGNRERKTAFMTSPTLGTGCNKRSAVTKTATIVKKQNLLTAKVKHSALRVLLTPVARVYLYQHCNKRSAVTGSM